jgi:hypothetical protein
MNKTIKENLNKLNTTYQKMKLELLKNNDVKGLEVLNKNRRIAENLILTTFGDDLTKLNNGEEIVIG